MAYLEINKTNLVNLEYSLKREIVRTNRSGSYACTTIIDCNTRKYHGLLICPLPKLDGGRHVLLSGIDETIIQYEQEFNLGMHKYAGDNYEPKGHKYISDFSSSPIPSLEYNVGDVVLSKEKILIENESQLLIKYTLIDAKTPVRIKFKPFLAFRNIHTLSKANMDVNTKFTPIQNGISSRLYNGYPDLFLQFSKTPEFVPAPDWYYNIEYEEDHRRGYDYKEDLYVPGFFEISLKKGESIILSASLKETPVAELKKKFNTEIKKRIPRDNFNTCLANTVQQFFIHNNQTLDIIAGFPWLPIRSRDALIALPGLTLPFYDEKSYIQVLSTVASKFENHLIKEIPEDKNGGYPIDIPLWFIWSVQQYVKRYGKKNIWKQLGQQMQRIIAGYINEKDLFEVTSLGLLYSKNNAYPNSWMNSWRNNEPLLPRKGYLVEANGLWYNALCFVLEFENEIKNKTLISSINEIKSNIESSFSNLFWNENTGYLNDYVFEDEINTQLRPNQLFAASLPYTALPKHQIKAMVDRVTTDLLTPYGIRSLSPIDSQYIPTYEGNHETRENAAFNGSVWPWLLTAYFEAFFKIDPKGAVRMSEHYFMNFENELQINGICSISELYHGNPPQKAKGAISFAMNTGELVRLKDFIDTQH
jgi:predicted glycogen debranching enzyme